MFRIAKSVALAQLRSAAYVTMLKSEQLDLDGNLESLELRVIGVPRRVTGVTPNAVWLDGWVLTIGEAQSVESDERNLLVVSELDEDGNVWARQTYEITKLEE